jgi:proteasome accessory factor B
VPSADKLQRWLDLLAALLVRHYGATFDDLARDVPGYAHDGSRTGLASAKRTFERDKDELRTFGVPIESVTRAGQEDETEGHRYVLKPGAFYLPFVHATIPDAPQPHSPGGSFYAALPRRTLALDELEAIARAGDRAKAVGDPILAMEAEEALRKLAFDQPLAAAADGVVHVEPASSRAPRDVHLACTEALRRRKTLTFTYRSIGRDVTAVRTVEAYGLVLVGGHWYLVGRDVEAAAMRQFRLSRMTKAKVQTARPNSADYEIPPTFDLGAYAASREAWELGDGDAVEAEVAFDGVPGAHAAVVERGQPVPGREGHRTFRVRRLDAFARWLLSFAGGAVPVAPAALVTTFDALVRDTLAHYAPEDA